MHKHQLTKIAEWKKEFGKSAQIIIPAPRNNAVFLETFDKNGDRFLLFGNKILKKFNDRYQFHGFAISPDGQKAAFQFSDATGNQIFINDQLAYRPDLDTVHHMSWIDNNSLAWDGWKEDENGKIKDDGIRYFLNGEDKTGTFRFVPFYDGSVTISVPGKIYTRLDDGTITEEREFDWKRIKDFDWYEPENRQERPRIQLPEPVWDEERDTMTGISFNDKVYSSHDFDELEQRVGQTCVLNSDQTLFACVGVTYSLLVKKLMGAAISVIEMLEQEKPETNKAVRILYPFAWIAALLADPYFGPLYIYAERSKKYCVLKHETLWKKRYKYVSPESLMFTPENNLVAAVYPNNKSCTVAIDEDEGPRFDEIWNVRYLKDENCVCYLGLRDHNFYRVVVN